jgi:hypothetical protein
MTLCGFENECASYPDCQGCPWDGLEVDIEEKEPVDWCSWCLAGIGVLALASATLLILWFFGAVEL